MKRRFAVITGLAVILTITVFSCDKKKNNKNAITPDYGATGNPNPNNQTVTGAPTFTNPATLNTSLPVGGAGWSNPTCISSGSLILKGVNDNISVTLTFNSAATSNTYAISTTPSSGACALTVVNAPGQPAGTVWIGKGGSVVVSTNSTAINAQLINVVCTQQTFNFPTVNVTGAIGCSQ